MATCPKCGKGITELNAIIVDMRCEQGYHDGEVDWSNSGELFGYEIEKFRCPMCYEVVTYDREEADELLSKTE